MIPVTDPDLLGQLNGAAPALKPVDPETAAALDGSLSVRQNLRPGQPSLTEAFQGLSAPGAAASAWHGLRSNLIDAPAQLLVHSLPTGMVSAVNKAADATGIVPGATPEQVDQGISQREADYQAQRAASGKTGFDFPRMVGEMGAGIPIARALPVGRSLLGSVIPGIASGAAYGASNPVTDPNADFWKEKFGQVKTGAIAGGLTTPLGFAVSRVVQPDVNPQVRALMDRGVTPLPGQILGGTAATLEEKATSLPFIGDMIKNAQRRGVDDFNRATYNEILAPIGQRSAGAIGHEAFADAETKLGGAYDRLLPNLTFRADHQLATDLQNLSGMAANMPPQQAAQFTNVLRNKVFSRLAPTGMMDGETFKGVESELNRIVTGYRKDPSFDNRELGSALGEVLTSLRSTLERGNPQYAGELAPINRGWAMLTRARNAASRLGADEGAFTPAQLLSAVRAGDQSVGKGATARGSALMQELAEAGKSVLGSKYPDSGTAGRYLLGSGAAALTGHVSPLIPLGAAAAAVPYSRAGQYLLSQLLANRPAGAAPLAAAIRQGIAPGTAGVVSSVLRQPGLPMSLVPNFP